MSTSQVLLSCWDWEPSVVIGCAALMIAYLIAIRFRAGWRMLSFALGDGILFLALVSPIDTLSDHYLFSAHMLQHLLLLLIVPPLLLAGIPKPLAERLLRIKWIPTTENFLRRPAVAWLIGIGTIVAWHIPGPYDLAVRSEAIHIVEHICFLVSSTIFWWPVLAPRQESRMEISRATLYLIGALLANTVLGIIITFAPVGFYSAYLHPTDDLGILPLLRDGWGLSTAADQQLGGILMWVPGCAIYLIAILGVFARWITSHENLPLNDPRETAEPALNSTHLLEANNHG